MPDIKITKPPLKRLHNLGLLTNKLQAVHMNHLTDQEIDILAQRKVNIIHCPESNMKLASGQCPIHKLQKAGINIALGTDGAASNNDLDMLGEARTAALLAKVTSKDPTTLPAHKVLEMATLGGAKAMGLQNQIGTIEKTKTKNNN